MTFLSKYYVNLNFMKKFKKPVIFLMAVVMFVSSIQFGVLAALNEPEIKLIDGAPINLNEEVDVTKVPILNEVVDLREKNSKIFLKADGLFEKSTYLDDIHYLDNGKWKDIDNRLDLDVNANEYENKANSFKIKLPKSIHENKKIKLSYEDYQIDWTVNGINKSEIDVIQKQNLKSDDLRELMNINQSVIYKNILNDVDLEYVLKGNGIKENIILNQYVENFSLDFTYTLKGLTLIKNEQNDLVFVNSNHEEILYFNDLYMIDANGEISTEIEVKINEVKTGEYLITIVPNNDWLKDSNRAFPVKVDPTLEIKGSSYVRDKYVIDGYSGSYDNSSLYVGRNSNGNDYRAYIEFNLNQIIKNSTVTDVSLQLHKYSDNCSSACKIDVNGVETSYDLITGTSTINLSDSGRIYDYIYVNSSDVNKFYYFNVTKLVQKWLHEGKGIGTFQIMSNNSGYNEFIDFDPLNYTAGIAPILKVTYVNQRGLESYWTYHEQSNGAGTGYVNDYTGNLTFIHNDIAHRTERTGFSISHVYNSFDKSKNMGYGNGWRINVGEQVILDPSTNTYYIIDGDGSHRYFKSKSCSDFKEANFTNCAIAMDGSGDYYVLDGNSVKLKGTSTITKEYNLTINGMLSKITDSSTNDVTTISHTYFGGVYFVDKATDQVGNYVKFNYNSTLKLLINIQYFKKNDSSVLKLVEQVNYEYIGNDLHKIIHSYDYNQNGLKPYEGQSIFEYTTNQLIIKNTLSNELKYTFNTSGQVTSIDEVKVVLENSHDEYMTFNAESTQYDGIEAYLGSTLFYNYPLGGFTVPLRTQAYSRLVFITWNGTQWVESNSISYEDLLSTTELYFVEEGDQLAIYNDGFTVPDIYLSDDTPFAVYYDVSEQGPTSVEKKLGHVDIYYDLKKTTIIDYKGNKIQYTFDSYGRTINILDDHSNALFYQYENAIKMVSGTIVENYYLNNKIKQSSNPQKTIINQINNHSFENNLSSWTSNVDAGSAYISSTGLYGINALELERYTPYGSVQVSQQVTLDPGYYNISGYIKNDGNDYSNGAYITLIGASGYLNINPIYNSNVWTKYNLGFEVTSRKTITIVLVNDSVSKASFDNIQLIEGFIDTRYNMINNSSFENNSFYNWSATSYSIVNNDSLITQDKDLYDQVLGDFVLKTTGDGTEKKLSQTFTTYLDKKSNIVIGGWAKSKSIPNKGKVQINVTLSDSQNLSNSAILYFNQDNDDWQYQILSFKANRSTSNEKILTNVKVEIVYQGVSDAYFDGIQLYFDSYATNYNYDDKNGLLTEKIDPLGKKTTYVNNGKDITSISPEGEKTTYLGYDSMRKLTSVQNNSKITFTYDENGNIKSSKVGDSETKTVYENQLQCDEYGSCQIVKIEKLVTVDDYFETKTSYLGLGQYLDVQTDEFDNTLNYDYDTVTGLLKAITDANGQTVYVYDDFGRLKNVNRGTSGNEYIYENGKLKYINVNGFTYIFTYDEVDRLKEVGIASDTNLTDYNPLMKYGYKSYDDYLTNQLNEQFYGNGDSIKFVYDEENRVTDIYFKSKDKTEYELRFHYEYDSNNLLAKLTDHVNNISYSYNYDFYGRLKDVVDSSGNKVSYGYESNHGNMNKFSYNIKSNSNRTNYFSETNYFTDYARNVYDRTEYQSNGQTITKKYEYDTHLLQKLLGFTVTFGSNQIFKTNYYYDNSKVKYGNSTYRIGEVKVTAKTDTYQFIYEYDSIGNIKTVTEKKNNNIISSYSYDYDSLNQLKRENISTPNESVSYSYEYDNHGNMTYKREYDYTTDTLQTPKKIIKFYYNNSWKDQLTKVAIVDQNDDIKETLYDMSEPDDYDNLGNPLKYGDYNFDWEGRQLKEIKKGEDSYITFKYNDNGYRTSKKVITGINSYDYHSYYLEGDKVIFEEIVHFRDNLWVSTDIIQYTYDIDGTLISMKLNGTEYFYIRNLQQDIVALADINGKIVVRYEYDAWGNPISTKEYDSTGNEKELYLAKLNPYRYRGYRFDEETGYYYLNSRYYNPEIGRFINADGLVGPVGGLLTHNMYAYCQNNPVMYVDPSGYIRIKFLDKATSSIRFVTSYLSKTAIKSIDKLEKEYDKLYDAFNNEVVDKVLDDHRYIFDDTRAGINDAKNEVYILLDLIDSMHERGLKNIRAFNKFVTENDQDRFDYENIIVDSLGVTALVYGGCGLLNLHPAVSLSSGSIALGAGGVHAAGMTYYEIKEWWNRTWEK